MRIFRFLAPCIYALGLAMGSLTLGAGCGGGGGDNEATVPPRGEPSAEERKGRMESMKKAMQTQRSGR